MSLDSSTKNSIPRNLRRTVIHALLSCAVIGGSIVFSFLIENRNANVLLTSIKAIFRNDETIGNTALMSRRIADLESLGIIECVTLSSSSLGELYNTTFKDDCLSHGLNFVPSVWTKGDIKSLSGEPYQIVFKSSANGVYLLYLNLLRLTGLLLINGVLFWYWTHIDAKARALAKEEENSRVLEIQVKEQSELIADMKIESAIQRSLSTLAAQVAHDVRSPLSTLNMVIKTLDAIPEERRRLIERASIRINEIVNDLLHRYRHTSQTAHSETTLALCPGEIGPFLSEMFEEKRTAYTERAGLEMHLDIIDPHKSAILFNAKELARVLSNLINNAIESLEGPGTVTLALRSTARDIAIVVHDTGRGIPPEILCRLGKEPLTIGKEHTGSGTGIGLLHAQSTVEAMGGKFSIQSRVNMGTMVSMTFPRVDQAVGS